MDGAHDLEERTAGEPLTGDPRWRWILWALPAAALAAGLDGLLLAAHRSGAIEFKSWEHATPEPWTWVPFIHSPWFSQYMRAFDDWSQQTGTYPGELLMIVHIALAPLVVLLCVRLAADGDIDPRLAGLAGVLVALSATGFRPFEQYPLARLLTTACLVALLLYAHRGGPARWGAAVVLGVVAVQFHLSTWFVLLPLAILLGFSHPPRRRGMGVLVLVTLCVCWATMQDGVFANSLMDVFEQPQVENRGIFDTANWSNPTIEYANPLLFGSLLLFAVPAIRRAEPRGLPVAIAVALYSVVHLGLMQQGLALHRQAPEPHHYFELVDPLVIAVAVWALAAALAAWPEQRRRVLAGAAAVVIAHGVVLTQLVEQLLKRGTRW